MTKRIVAHRLVQDPSMSDAQYWHERQTKSGPHVGKVYVATNMVELIGGLARLSGATEMHIMAAAKYRMAYDRAQIGGARAADYAAVKVDPCCGEPCVKRSGVKPPRRWWKPRLLCLGCRR